MNIIRPDSMPRLWWLNPWATCRYLHQALVAVTALADRQDAVIRGEYAKRPRWQIDQHESEEGVRYYFYDTFPDLGGGIPYVAFRGKTYLYDGPSKYFAFETDPAKAIARVNDLNR